MPKPSRSMHAAELSELLAILDGARLHRAAPDYDADALLLLELMEERRFSLLYTGVRRVFVPPLDDPPMSPEDVQSARQRLGITRRQLGLLAGIDPNTVARYEQGEGKAQLRTARALSLALRAAGAASSAE